MSKIFLLSLLLVLVYSWDDIKGSLRFAVRRFIRKKQNVSFHPSESDRLVSLTIMTAAVPVSILLWAGSGQNLYSTLVWLALSLLAVSLVAAGAGLVWRRMRMTRDFEGADQIFPAIFSAAGLFAPALQLVSGTGSMSRRQIAGLTFWLSLPFFAALAIGKIASYAHPGYEITVSTDRLVFVLAGAILTQITVDLLRKAFRAYRFRRLSSYVRIAIGIVVVWLVLMG